MSGSLTIIEEAFKVAAERCATIIPHRITGSCATPEDMEALRADLEVLCRRIVDPIVAAYGEYAQHHFSGVIDQSLFKDQLADALEGNATYALERAADRIREEQSTAYANINAEHRTHAGVM